MKNNSSYLTTGNEKENCQELILQANINQRSQIIINKLKNYKDNNITMYNIILQ